MHTKEHWHSVEMRGLPKGQKFQEGNKDLGVNRYIVELGGCLRKWELQLRQRCSLFYYNIDMDHTLE